MGMYAFLAIPLILNARRLNWVSKVGQVAAGVTLVLTLSALTYLVQQINFPI